MCSRFPDEVLGILAWLETLLVPLRSVWLGQSSPVRVMPAMPGCTCQCPSSLGKLQALSVPGPIRPQSQAEPSSSWELERCMNETCDLTGIFVVLCCWSFPKTAPIALWGCYRLSIGQKTLQGCHNPRCCLWATTLARTGGLCLHWVLHLLRFKQTFCHVSD